MKHFEGKTAVVTGAASGIGFGLAQRFAEENMQVVMADLEQTALEEAVEKLEKQQHRVVGIPADVLIEEAVNELYSKSRETFGNIHVLCNNAGIAASSGNKPIWEVERTDWQWTLGVNFYGVLYGIQAFLPHMIEHGEDGHVVTTASLAGLIRGAGPYGVSKHAVRALAETLNSDLVARGAKIRSSVLCPGFVNTNIGKSERNRPSNLTQLQAPLEDIENSPIMALLRNGKEPSEIAEIVIEAIRDDLFYILPHPAWDDTLKTYFEEILSREALNSPSLPAFLTPRDDGEKY